MTDADVTPAHAKRGRVVMLVDNGVYGDSRVQKQAASAAAAGWDVVLLGSAPPGEEKTWRIGDAEVRLVSMPSPLNRRRHTFRRSWLRFPLAYAPSGIARYRQRQAQLWHHDLRVRRAALEQRVARLGAGSGQARLRPKVQRLMLQAERLAARVVSRWVGKRAYELQQAERARALLTTRRDRFYTAFWRKVQGDGSWRRLEPRLWDFELAFGPVIDELQPDLIHANDFYMLGVGARAMIRARAQGRKVPLVWDAHEFLPGIRPRNDNARWVPAHTGYEREFVKYADAGITVSEELADLLQREHNLPYRPAVVLNAPDVDPTKPAGDAPDIRVACGVGPDVPLVVYSGAAAPQRGMDTMIEALPQLEGVHVGLVTSYPLSKYMSRVLALAEELGVADRVHAVPYVRYDQVVGYLSKADIGVIPLHHWPNHEIALITKYFEYAHARLPIVVSDVKAMAEVTRSTGVGEVFRAQDVEDYVRVVKIVLADKLRYLAAYDAPGLLQRWTWAAQASVLDEVYGRLVPGAAAAGSKR